MEKRCGVGWFCGKHLRMLIFSTALTSTNDLEDLLIIYAKLYGSVLLSFVGDESFTSLQIRWLECYQDHHIVLGCLCRLKRIARKNRKNPNRQRLVAAIKRKVREDYLPNRRGMWQQYRDGVFIASLNIFDWFTPSRPRRGTLWVTPILLILALVVFAFMAGAYPLYLALEGEGEDIASLGWEPKTVLSFMEGGIHGGRKFTFNFLLKWGGRYLPNIAQGEAYRWFTSVILHQSTMHLLSNGIIFIFIGSHLELKYGGLCVLWTIVLAGMGGNFLSALMEAHCSMVVGASGIVFGLVAFGLADLVFDKEANPTILARVFAGVMVTLFFIMTFVLKEYSSHVSHLGGFICGLVPSLLFHKSLVNEVIEAGTVWGVLGFLLIYFSIIPSVLYSHVLSNLTCWKANSICTLMIL